MAAASKRPKLDEAGATDGFNAAEGGTTTTLDTFLMKDLEGQSRPRFPQLPADSQVVILDIEGTTTLISFVHDELFPFAKLHCRRYLETHWDDEALQKAIRIMRTEAADDVLHPDKYPDAIAIPDGPKPEALEAVVKAVEWQMAMDRKAGGLKALQGLIWKDGYASGELKGHVFEDAYAAMDWWKKHGVKVYIYSSGSVGAQKLLFGNSKFGDMLHLIDGHFDTAIGAKVESKSYESISEQLSVPAAELVFVSDSEKELVAAKEAGIGWPVMCVRPGNAPLTAASNGLPAVRSLLELCRCNDE